MPPEPIDRFEALFKVWASRPPATPADEAVHRMLRRLPTAPVSRPALSWLRVAAASAAALAVVLATHFYFREASVSSVPKDTALGLVQVPLVPDGVALVWLDSGTPLYLTLTSPVIPEGEPPS